MELWKEAHKLIQVNIKTTEIVNDTILSGEVNCKGRNFHSWGDGHNIVLEYTVQ